MGDRHVGKGEQRAGQAGADPGGDLEAIQQVISALEEQLRVGVCDPSTGICAYPAAPEGAACDDGDECTQYDTCESGACVGAFPVVCQAASLCHLPGTCDPQTGKCTDPTEPDDRSEEQGDVTHGGRIARE